MELTFTRRTSGHCLVTFKSGNCGFPSVRACLTTQPYTHASPLIHAHRVSWKLFTVTVSLTSFPFIHFFLLLIVVTNFLHLESSCIFSRYNFSSFSKRCVYLFFICSYYTLAAKIWTSVTVVQTIRRGQCNSFLWPLILTHSLKLLHKHLISFSFS